MMPNESLFRVGGTAHILWTTRGAPSYPPAVVMVSGRACAVPMWRPGIVDMSVRHGVHGNCCTYGHIGSYDNVTDCHWGIKQTADLQPCHAGGLLHRKPGYAPTCVPGYPLALVVPAGNPQSCDVRYYTGGNVWDQFGPPSEDLRVEGMVNSRPVKVLACSCIAPIADVIGNPVVILIVASCLDDGALVSCQLWCFGWVFCGEDRHHHPVAFQPDQNILHQAPLWEALDLLAAFACLVLLIYHGPCFWQQLGHVDKLQVQDPLSQLGREACCNRGSWHWACKVRGGGREQIGPPRLAVEVFNCPSIGTVPADASLPTLWDMGCSSKREVGNPSSNVGLGSLPMLGPAYTYRHQPRRRVKACVCGNQVPS